MKRGQLKDMACRAMLLKLEQKGLICLPAGQRPSNNRCSWGPGPLAIGQWLSPSPIETGLSTLEPLSIVPAQSPEELALFDWLLWRYHYLTYSGAAGEKIKYLAFDRRARPLACLLYGAAAWKLSLRDQFIGWSKEQRQANLSYLANNLRFLILPWVRVKNLASYLLSASLSMLAGGHWQFKYGHPIYLVETFVDSERFRGTCYRAANWLLLGQTQGRGRNDRSRQLRLPIKDIYVRALCEDFRRRLTQSRAPEQTAAACHPSHRLVA